MGDRQLDVLHLVTRSHRRGAELVALELAAELDALGHANRVVALSTGEGGDQVATLPPLVDSPGVGPSDLLGRAARVRRLLSDSNVDVIVAHGGFAAQVAALAALGRGPKLVWQRIDVIAESVWSRPRRWWWRWTARRFDAAVALTQQLEDELRRLGFSGPIWRIPNFRNPDRFRELDREPRRFACETRSASVPT